MTPPDPQPKLRTRVLLPAVEQEARHGGRQEQSSDDDAVPAQSDDAEVATCDRDQDERERDENQQQYTASDAGEPAELARGGDSDDDTGESDQKTEPDGADTEHRSRLSSFIADLLARVEHEDDEGDGHDERDGSADESSGEAVELPTNARFGDGFSLRRVGRSSGNGGCRHDVLLPQWGS